MRAPIWIYQARLGFLFGSRLLMLEHIGRRTSARRYVVLEVIEHQPPDTYVVISGFGDRAQWFRNVLDNPSVQCLRVQSEACAGPGAPPPAG